MPNYGAPTMQPTGNPQWDGAFGSLANAFGADPSKPAEAYYAGAKAREAQIAADRAISQSRAQPYVTGALWGQGQPAPTYSTSNMGVTMLNAPPGTSPPAAAPPPAQGLGATIAGWLPWSHTPAQAADQTANAVQQTPGPTPPPMSPPSATAPPAPTATGSNGSVVPDPGHGPFGGASFNSGGGGVIKAGPATDNGMPSPANFNMAQFHAMQVAQGVPGDQAAIQDRAVIGEWVKSGRMSQPLADSLLASYGEASPRTTTISGETQRATTAMNNATTLANTKLTQTGAYGTFTDPKNPGGSPITTTAADAQARGLTPFQPTIANTVQTQGGTYGTYTDPTKPNAPPITATSADAAARGLTPFQPTIANTIVGAQVTYGDYIDPKTPNAPPIHTTAADAQARGLTAFQPTIANTTQTQTGAYGAYTDPKNPSAPPITTTAADAQARGLTPYNATVANTIAGHANEYRAFLNKAGQTVLLTNAEGAKQGLSPVPAGTDQRLATAITAINNAEPGSEKQQALIDQEIKMQGQLTPLKPPDEDAANQREFLLNEQLNAMIPPPSGSMNWGKNENPAGPSTELGPPLSKLTAEYFNRGPPGIKGNAVEAAKAAIADAVQQGYVNLHQSRSRGGAGVSDAATTILRPNYTKEGKPLPEPQKFFRVDLLNPNTGLPYVDPVTGEPMVDPATGKAPIDKRTGKPTTETKPPTEIPMLQKSMSSALTSQTAPPQGAIAQAPPGTPDGPQTMGGKRVMVQGGWVFAAQ